MRKLSQHSMHLNYGAEMLQPRYRRIQQPTKKINTVQSFASAPANCHATISKLLSSSKMVSRSQVSCSYTDSENQE